MKKILKYVIWLIALIIVVRVLVYFLTKTYYQDMNNYEILVKSPVIEVTESKVAKNRGYIQGTATNDTGTLISNVNLKFDFYNENGKFVGSEYKLIEVFNATEQVKFDIKYQYENVAEIKISIVKQ